MNAVAQDQNLGQSLYKQQHQELYQSADRLFAKLLMIQWVACIALAYWFSPLTWIGEHSQVHEHIWAAVLLVGALALLPSWFAWKRPGQATTRYLIAMAQMLIGAVAIHLAGGRVEFHFHVFCSLAVLTYYRDWKVILIATIVVAADHLIRSLFWPLSIYNVASGAEWRWLEHAAWVVFEDIFLMLIVVQGVQGMKAAASRQASAITAQEEATTANQSITNAVSSIVSQLKSIQESGDLTKKFELDVEGEFAVLQDNLNCFIENQREVIQSINTTSKDVADGVHVINNTAETIAKTITHVVSASDESVKIATEAGEEAREGATVINNTIHGMNQINNAVSSTSTSIQSLAEHGNAIQELVEVIDEIAEQTQLLALNATIEAARAGEHGKSFAIVADEVRQLADHTARSTQSVADVVQKILSATQDASERMNLSMSLVEKGVTEASTAEGRLQQIVEGSNRVNQKIIEIRDSADGAVEHVDETFSAVKTLDGRFRKLVETMSHFEVEV